jgi:hypothetical protein
MTNNWVTSRLPTKEDADEYGNVQEKISPYLESSTAVHWSQTSVGVPWRHTSSWGPPLSEPDEDLVQRISTLEARVGELENLIKSVAKATPRFF